MEAGLKDIQKLSHVERCSWLLHKKMYYVSLA